MVLQGVVEKNERKDKRLAQGAARQAPGRYALMCSIYNGAVAALLWKVIEDYGFSRHLFLPMMAFAVVNLFFLLLHIRTIRQHVL